jgi:GntR family transcriptional regulator, histidine utilization repressor
MTRRSSDTLHERIQSDVEDRILSGRWPPGHRIPFEHELMEQYDCSRMTVNKVLSSLAQRGLIRRRRRIGSFVENPTHHAAVLEIPDIQGDVVRRGKEYRFHLIAQRVRAPRAADANEMELAGSGKLLEIECVHYENDAPFALESRLISLATVPQAAKVDFNAVAPGTWLLSHVAWSEAEHTITAAAASSAEAKRLQIQKGGACLSLERRTWKRGKPVTYVRQLFPGNKHSLTARFTPGTRAQARTRI